jgi:hypothetical protein
MKFRCYQNWILLKSQDNRLLANARNFDDDDDVTDDWAKHLKDPLDHTNIREQRLWLMQIRELFTGGEECKHLAIGKNDIKPAKSRTKHNIAKGQVTLDIDSILAMFTDLMVINMVIAISVISSPIRNLKQRVHLAHQGAPLHHIPHFDLSQFGHDPKFDLYVMLPALYNEELKRRRGKLYNHVPEDIRAVFMNMCFLPALEEVIGHHEGQSWDFSYDILKAKSNAAAREGNKFRRKPSGFRQEIYVDLGSEHIKSVWHCCRRRLRIEMRRGGKLGAFLGFQFFVNSKGHKHRVKADEFSELIMVYKEKVKMT